MGKVLVEQRRLWRREKREAPRFGGNSRQPLAQKCLSLGQIDGFRL